MSESACDEAVSHLRAPLDSIFAPASVALVGATEREGSVGRSLLDNLMADFPGPIYPINPKRPHILGLKAYPSISALPETPDFAVVVTPAPTVPGVIRECVARGVKGAIVISAGFKELGAPGVALEREVVAAAAGKIRIVGPNCLGVMNPISKLNATFAAKMARPGNVGFISQSGALCTAILDWSFRENVGFSAFVSTGSMLDINWGDLIYHLGDDPHTKSIVIYMETIGNARAFLSAAREIALSKPIIVIKAGRTSEAAKAAASHTGALAGSDESLNAAFRRCGVLRVDSISDLFNMSEVLSKQPRPRGPRLTMITNAGGPGVLATDALITNGGKLAEISGETIENLNKILPEAWSHGNPIDVLGDADANRYANAVKIAAADPNSDGLLLIMTPQAMTDPTAMAEKVRDIVKGIDKPILASWMGGISTDMGNEILNLARIPTFAYPDTAARMFQYMWQYSANLERLYETPEHTTEDDSGVSKAHDLLAAARRDGRTLLSEIESKELLASYGIPTVSTRHARCAEDAAQAADAIGYPVVLKLHSLTITHKTDVGGVKLNLQNAEDVRRAYNEIQESVTAKAGAEHFLGVSVQPMIRADGYEIILGSSIDDQFGPVLLFGMGGQLVEVFKDRALALPPLTTTLARQLMERTKIFGAFKGVRGRNPVDLEALDHVVVRFSQLVVEQPWIKEIDINPLLVSAEKILALDARVVLHNSDISDDKLPRAAIRPYPRKYVSTWGMRDGTPLTIRPIRPDDEPLVAAFHGTLSERTVRLRYMYSIPLEQRIAHDRLTRICFIDYDREIALVAERESGGKREMVGIGRLAKLHGVNAARISLLVSDAYQSRGLGLELMQRLIQVARDEKIQKLSGEIPKESEHMQKLCKKLGFTLMPCANGAVAANLAL